MPGEALGAPRPSAVEGGADTPSMGSSGLFETRCGSSGRSITSSALSTLRIRPTGNPSVIAVDRDAAFVKNCAGGSPIFGL